MRRMCTSIGISTSGARPLRRQVHPAVLMDGVWTLRLVKLRVSFRALQKVRPKKVNVNQARQSVKSWRCSSGSYLANESEVAAGSERRQSRRSRQGDSRNRAKSPPNGSRIQATNIVGRNRRKHQRPISNGKSASRHQSHNCRQAPILSAISTQRIDSRRFSFLQRFYCHIWRLNIVQRRRCTQRVTSHFTFSGSR